MDFSHSRHHGLRPRLGLGCDLSMDMDLASFSMRGVISTGTETVSHCRDSQSLGKLILSHKNCHTSDLPRCCGDLMSGRNRVGNARLSKVLVSTEPHAEARLELSEVDQRQHTNMWRILTCWRCERHDAERKRHHGPKNGANSGRRCCGGGGGGLNENHQNMSQKQTNIFLWTVEHLIDLHG